MAALQKVYDEVEAKRAVVHKGLPLPLGFGNPDDRWYGDKILVLQHDGSRISTKLESEWWSKHIRLAANSCHKGLPSDNHTRDPHSLHIPFLSAIDDVFGSLPELVEVVKQFDMMIIVSAPTNLYAYAANEFRDTPEMLDEFQFAIYSPENVKAARKSKVAGKSTKSKLMEAELAKLKSIMIESLKTHMKIQTTVF
jgi:hypothetical protein